MIMRARGSIRIANTRATATCAGVRGIAPRGCIRSLVRGAPVRKRSGFGVKNRSLTVAARFLGPLFKHPLTSIALAGIVLAAASPAVGQLRPLVIKDARVLNPGTGVIEKTCLKIAGGKIAAIQPNIKTGFFTKTIDGTGKTVTPGFIDCWSQLGLLPGGPAGPDTASRVMDSFDRYARAPMLDALAHGVTAIFAAPGSTTGIAGMGSVFRITPWGAVGDRVLVEESALCTSVGVAGNQGAIARVKASSELRKKLKSAKDYRQSLEDYEEELEEYEKKLKERKEKEEKEKEKEKGNDGDKEKDGNDAPKTSSKNEKNDKENDKPGNDKKEEKKDKEDEIKKPTEPPRNPEAKMLLRILDGELMLRVETHRPADILNVLRTAEEFSIRLILVGASGGHLVADAIADAKVPVIVGQTVRTARFENNAYRYHSPDNAAKLAEAGVSVYIAGGGGGPAGTKLLGFNTALAIGHGLDADDALQSVTSKAAKLLGIDDRVGRIAQGMEADLVIWSGDPFSPDAKVEKVLIGGAVVYDASKDWPFGASP